MRTVLHRTTRTRATVLRCNLVEVYQLI